MKLSQLLKRKAGKTVEKTIFRPKNLDALVAEQGLEFGKFTYGIYNDEDREDQDCRFLLERIDSHRANLSLFFGNRKEGNYASTDYIEGKMVSFFDYEERVMSFGGAIDRTQSAKNAELLEDNPDAYGVQLMIKLWENTGDETEEMIEARLSRAIDLAKRFFPTYRIRTSGREDDVQQTGTNPQICHSRMEFDSWERRCELDIRIPYDSLYEDFHNLLKLELELYKWVNVE
jgi:hypothetical protein